MRRAALIGLVVAGLAAPALAQAPASSAKPPGNGELRELIEAVRESAKVMRENTDYARAVPDILTQILAKLDKIENKLDKVENAVKASSGKPGARR